MAVECFEDLNGWQAARKLCAQVYRVSGENAFAHDCPLREQIRRASISAVSNIAEGFDAGSQNEFIRFLRYAQRSISEVRAQLFVALDQGYGRRSEFDELQELCMDAFKLTGGLIRYLLNHADETFGEAADPFDLNTSLADAKARLGDRPVS